MIIFLNILKIITDIILIILFFPIFILAVKELQDSIKELYKELKRKKG